MRRLLLIALDSVGIDPLGHDRPESVYAQSRFLFPQGQSGALLSVTDGPIRGALVETDVVGNHATGAIECAITYTSIFSGKSAIDRHGLMVGLGLKEKLLKELVEEDNLFRHFGSSCLANALFPFHVGFLGSSHVDDLLPRVDRPHVEKSWRYCGQPLRLKGRDKHGFAELFTLAEINQNIFVYAARRAGVRLRTWDDVRRGEALTSSMTHELEADFDFCGLEPLPVLAPTKAADVLATLVQSHDFTFYKYQLSDLISHMGRIELARQVFALIEDFLEAILRSVDAHETVVLVTSDHGHLEQVATSHAHPKTRVPTWCFGPEPMAMADKLRRPEAIFHCLRELRAVNA